MVRTVENISGILRPRLKGNRKKKKKENAKGAKGKNAEVVVSKLLATTRQVL